MKKTRLTAVLLTLVILAGLTASLTVESTAADKITVVVDGKTVRFPDAPAFVDGNSRTQIPVRYVGEAMGMLVEWDNTARRATFSMEINGLARHVDFYIGSDVFYVKDAPDNIPESKTMNTTAFVRDSRTYVPVRYLAEAFGATVQWDSGTRTVVIESSADAAPLPTATSTPSKPGAPEYPADGSQYDEDGYFLAQYANVFYDQLLESLRITYEGGKVFLNYTVPEGLPEDVELQLTITSRSLDEYVMYSDMWVYKSIELSPGDREAGKSYLMPNLVSGDVAIEMDYIPYEYLRYIDFWCGMSTPRNARYPESRRFAQSSYRMFLYPNDPQESVLHKFVFNKWNSRVDKYYEKVSVDISNFVVFK